MRSLHQKRKSPPLEEEKRLKPENDRLDLILITNILFISLGTKAAKRPAITPEGRFCRLDLRHDVLHSLYLGPATLS